MCSWTAEGKYFGVQSKGNWQENWRFIRIKLMSVNAATDTETDTDTETKTDGHSVNVPLTRPSLAQIIAFASPAASHYMSQCWLVINWTPRNIVHLNRIWKSKFFIPENAFKNIVCNMWANCLGLEVLTGQMRLWSTFWPSPHLYRRWFMGSIYECDLKWSMCVNKYLCQV